MKMLEMMRAIVKRKNILKIDFCSSDECENILPVFHPPLELKNS